jgi:hypothetical protein
VKPLREAEPDSPQPVHRFRRCGARKAQLVAFRAPGGLVPPYNLAGARGARPRGGDRALPRD